MLLSLEPGGGLDYGGSSVRGGDGDIDPASAVGGVHISLLRELLVRYVPFAVDISLWKVTPVKMRVELLSHQYRHSPPDWAQQEPVPHVMGRLGVNGKAHHSPWQWTPADSALLWHLDRTISMDNKQGHLVTCVTEHWPHLPEYYYFLTFEARSRLLLYFPLFVSSYMTNRSHSSTLEI